jgi:DNA-binding response OmpR family regulator
MKVLLVEDDAGVREGLCELVSEQADVRDVGSVAEALAALRSELFDLVLTDLRIGGDRLGGRTILEAARERLVPVAIMSASVPEEVQRALAPFQADAQLTKPFQLDDVLALVERFLRLRTDTQGAGTRPPVPERWGGQGGMVQVLRAGEGSWIRLAPGARAPWPRQAAPEGVLVVEGELELNGERRGADQYFYVSADGGCEAASREGCLAVSLPLPPGAG